MNALKNTLSWLLALVLASVAAGLTFYVLEVVVSSEARANAGIELTPIGIARLLAALAFSAFFYGSLILPFSFIPALIVSGSWELSGHKPSALLYGLTGLLTAVGGTAWLTLSYANFDFSDAWKEWLADDWVLTPPLAAAGLAGGILFALIRLGAFHGRQKTPSS